MAALANRAIRRVRGSDGFTLPELLVATMIGLLIVGVSATVFGAALQSQPGLTARDTGISHARTTMERLTRELRQGASVSTATSTQLAFVTYVHSATCGGAPASTAIACRVTYSCGSSSCTRREARPDGTSPGPTVTVVSGLSTGNVFTYSPNSTAATYIGATLVFPGQNGDDAISVSDGVTLRNSASAS
jgi:prepilin-type N-terminal cleavage/methylation domain-containing protein